MNKNKMTREKKEEGIEAIVKRLVEGGWSSIYNFVENHASNFEIEEALGYDEEGGDDED